MNNFINDIKNTKSTLFLTEHYIKNHYKLIYDEINNYDFNINNNITLFSNKLFNYINKISSFPKCEICKKEVLSFYKFKTGYHKTCSKECSKILSIKNYKKTCLERYGVDSPLKCKIIKNKLKDTNFKKYGVEYSFQNNNIKEKIKETNLKKYGVEHSLQRKEIKEKIKETNLERYGVDNPAKNKEVQNKIKKTNLERYDVVCAMQHHIIQHNIRKKINDKNLIRIKNLYNINIIELINGNVKIKCNKCNNNYNIRINHLYHRIKANLNPCLLCYPIDKSRSNREIEIIKFLNDYNIKIEENIRYIITPLEIDIYLPNNKIGIEFNGLYWHSELHKNKEYHINKTLLAKKKGVKLIHIWEDDWINKQDIIKSRLKQLLNLTYNRIYARKCIIKEVLSKENSFFLNNNHLQGNVNAAVKLGLYYNDELVSLMTFGKLRKNLGQKAIEGEYELLRFVNKLDTTVIGGASRLFKYFIKEYKPNRVISYADCDWTSDEQDNLYIKLGFSFDYLVKPNYYWSNFEIKENRFKYRKDVLVKEGADPNLTEVEIMHDKGYNRIWNSGNLKFSWNE